MTLTRPTIKKAKAKYEAVVAENAEREIQRQHGVTGEAYISQLKEKKKTATSKEEKDEISEQIKAVRKSLYGDSNWFKYIGDSVKEGVSSVNSSTMSAANFLVGKPLQFFGWENNPISSSYEHYKEKYEEAAADTDRAGKAVGDDSGFIGDVASGVTAAVPDLLLSYLTGGGSATAKLGTSAIAKANPTILNTTQKLVEETATSPIFYTSFIRELGTNYDEAMASGEASETEAVLFTLFTSAINARIEMGGFQALPDELAGTKGGWNKFKKFLLSNADEGFEELNQGVVTNTLAKVFYDHNKAIISSTDQNAILNPTRQFREFEMGTIVGGLLGGANLTFNAIVSARSDSQYKEIGKAAAKVADIQDIINYCKNAYNDDVRTIAREINKTNITEADTGRLYQYVIRDIMEKFDDVYTEAEFGAVVNRYFTSDTSGTIRNIASGVLQTS